MPCTKQQQNIMENQKVSTTSICLWWSVWRPLQLNMEAKWIDFRIQNLLPVVTLQGLHVGFLPPSLQRSCSRWSWEPNDAFLLECTSSFTFPIFDGQGKRALVCVYHGLGIPHSMSDKKDLSACWLHMAVSQHFSHSSVSSTESWKRRSCRKFSWSSCEHVNV